MCYKNGGAVFLIPYVIILLFIGKPFYFLEMVLGQFTSKGSIKGIQAIPLLKGKNKVKSYNLNNFLKYLERSSTQGVGWGQQIASGIITTYYSAVIAITLAYVVKSFSMKLPWSDCSSFNGSSCQPADLPILPNNDLTENKTSSAELFFRFEVFAAIIN